MSVFFTDSDCEIWYTDVDKYNMKVVEMPYTIDGEEKFYDMGRATDFKQFYDKMRAGSTPKTSALNPYDYTKIFEPYFIKGEDILYVHFSSEMSGTFGSMSIALKELKEKYPNVKFTEFDTKSISTGAGIQALVAAKMHEEGKSDEEIVDFLKDFSAHTATYFVVDDLKYLKKGGRISPLVATVGTLLNIKPIIRVSDEGKLDKYSSGKGMKGALNVILQKFKETYRSGYPIYIVDADNQKYADALSERVREIAGKSADIVRLPVGPVIGSHCGPGTVGLIFYAEKR